MLNSVMGMTDDRSAKVGHYVATLAVVACSFKLSFAEFCCGL